MKKRSNLIRQMKITKVSNQCTEHNGKNEATFNGGQDAKGVVKLLQARGNLPNLFHHEKITKLSNQ